MADRVSIFFTSDGQEWAEYLKAKLSCKNCDINTELVNIEDKNIDFSSKVNVFLVFPDLLNLKSWDILDKFDSKTAIAVLAGVELNDWVEAASKHHVESVQEWLDYELEENDQSVRELLVSIIGIYELREEFGDDVETAWNHYINVPAVEKKSDNETFYKTLPSRPSRQVNSVTHVLRKDDQVYLLLERMAEGKVEVSFHEDGRIVYPAFEGSFGLYTFPWIDPQQSTFDVLLEGAEIGYGLIDSLHENRNADTESLYDLPPPTRHSAFSSSTGSPKSVSYYYNEDMDNEPYDYPPAKRQDIHSSYSASSESSSTTSSVIITDSEMPQKLIKDASMARKSARGSSQSGGDSSSKLERIRKLLEDEMDPMNVLCECLNIPDNADALDDKLTSMLQATESLKDVPFPPVACRKIEECGSFWPTLLHFGAAFNLFKFCDSLLSSPLMYGACRIKNCDGHFPHDVARLSGNTELAQHLEAFSVQISLGQTGSHDSGFSQRLSNVSVSESAIAPPPPPRCSASKPRTPSKPEKGRLERPDMSLDFRHSPSPHPSVTSDGERTPTATLADIFQGTVFDRKSAFENRDMFYIDPMGEKSDSSSTGSKGTVKDEDSNSEEQTSRGVPKSQSESEVGQTKDSRKSGGFSFASLFRKKKQRSYSEPGMNQVEEAVRRKEKAKIYRKYSRKTDSNTSGYSTYSESSSGRVSDLKEDESEVSKRGKPAKKRGKDKLKLLLTNVQRRNSVRIDHMMKDEDIFAAYPLPRKSNEERF